MFIFDFFENRLVIPGLSQGAASKTTTFVKTTQKISSTSLIFYDSVMSSLGGGIKLKNWQKYHIKALRQ